jgi:hypothetical protein
VLARARAGIIGSDGDEAPSPESALTFFFMDAMHERDTEKLRALTHPSLELVYRRPEGDVWIEGDDAREALVRLTEDLFGRRYVGEWWGSAGGGPGEWWTSAPGKPFCSVFFSGVGGDATRVDVAMGLVLEEELVRRAVVISAGPAQGRPVTPGEERATA